MSIPQISNQCERQKVIEDILRDCMWDCHISARDIERILSSGNEKELNWLFGKILYNSREPVMALRLFRQDQLKRLFKEFVVPRYNRNFIERRFLILRFLFVGEKAKIRGLEWTI